MNLAEALQTVRKRKGLSRYRVAKEVGVAWQTVWKWELGVFKPRSDQFIKLLRLFPELLDVLEGGNGNGTEREKRR